MTFWENSNLKQCGPYCIWSHKWGLGLIDPIDSPLSWGQELILSFQECLSRKLPRKSSSRSKQYLISKQGTPINSLVLRMSPPGTLSVWTVGILLYFFSWWKFLPWWPSAWRFLIHTLVAGKRTNVVFTASGGFVYILNCTCVLSKTTFVMECSHGFFADTFLPSKASRHPSRILRGANLFCNIGVKMLPK